MTVVVKRQTGLATITDIDGQRWRICRRQNTSHGFTVVRGIRADHVGKCGPEVVLTAPLASYLRRVTRWAEIDLPIGVDAIKRMRAALKLNYSDARTAWWRDRLDDLGQLTTPQFARKHGVSIATVQTRRRQLVGTLQTQRPAGWWQEPAIAKQLLELPIDEAATRLGLGRTTVLTYRGRLGSGEHRKQRWQDLAEAASQVTTSANPEHPKFLTDDRYGITRIEYRENRWGWDVNISRRGLRHRRRFTDLQHGDAPAALTAATAYRDALLRELPPLSRREYCQIPRLTNTTGHAGVHRSTRRGVLYFVAHTRLPGGGALSKSFSTRKMGHEQALAAAAAERQHQLRHVTGTYVHSPAAQRIHNATEGPGAAVAVAEPM